MGPITPEEEGAFIACSFRLVKAPAILGHPDEAQKTMDALLAIAGTNLDPLNEMIDPDARAMLGNVPQDLSHPGADPRGDRRHRRHARMKAGSTDPTAEDVSRRGVTKT